MNKKTHVRLSALFLLFMSGFLNAYEASCKSETGKVFSILVQNEILTVDGKYRHYYKSKNSSGWYIYSNDNYTYSLGPFKNGRFNMTYSNHKSGDSFSGHCKFI